MSCFVSLLLFAAAARAATVTLPITADTSICAHPTEADLNAGGAQRIKLKGIENFILIRFDPANLAGRRVVRGVLRLKEAEPGPMIRHVGVSTVAAEWVEGIRGYEPAGPDESCFLRPGTGKGIHWAWPDSTFTDATFGHGGTTWEPVEAKRTGDGWWEIPIPGRILDASAAGLSDGFALSDDDGQAMNVDPAVAPGTNRGNNWFWSREKTRSEPRLTAVVEPAGPVTTRHLDVSVSPWARGATAAAGGAMLAWESPGPRDRVLGYRFLMTANGKAVGRLPLWMMPAVPSAGESPIARLAGFPSSAAIVARVEEIGAGGAVLAAGEGAGFASAVLDVPAAITPARVAAGDAGGPPGRGAARVWAVPDGCKVNPVTGNVLEEPGVAYEGPAAGAWRRGNVAWSGSAGTVRLAGIRGETLGWTLVCERPAGTPTTWRLRPEDIRGPRGSVIPAAAVRLSEARYQHVTADARGWYADPLTPLEPGTPFAVPDPRFAVPDQANQAVYIELRIPEDAAAGAWRGSLDVEADGRRVATVKVELVVGAAVLPREAHFVWSLNDYSSPGWAYGREGSTAFLAGERATYVLAHAHRGTLAIVPYSHSGNLEPGYDPPLTGHAAGMEVADWAAWDARFGPLFDGSAFAGDGRDGVGLDHFLLPLSESWPTPMAEGYQWNALRWEDHWKQAGPVERGFTPVAQAQWVAVAKDVLRHVRERGWLTAFLVYFNDKYYYKQYDPRRKAWGRGVSFWLFDEPMHADDFLALRFFGGLLREAQAGDRTRVQFRADVSRPEWSRDWLDRVLDLQVSGNIRGARRLLEGWREADGQRIWTYGGSPASTESALGLSAQALELWARGVDGYVPWAVLGSAESWTTFAPTSLIYPGPTVGLAEPCASLRLKAYRRAEQDVEYVWLLASARGWLRNDPNRRRIAALLEGALPQAGLEEALDAEGAKVAKAEPPSPERLEGLRRALEAAIEQGPPSSGAAGSMRVH